MTDIPDWLSKIRAAEAARTRGQWHTSEMVPHIVCVGSDYYVLKTRRREDAAFAARATDPEHGLAALAERLREAERERDCYKQLRDDAVAELRDWKNCNLYPQAYREAVEELFTLRKTHAQVLQQLQVADESATAWEEEAVKLRTALAAVGGK